MGLCNFVVSMGALKFEHYHPPSQKLRKEAERESFNACIFFGVCCNQLPLNLVSLIWSATVSCKHQSRNLPNIPDQILETRLIRSLLMYFRSKAGSAGPFGPLLVLRGPLGRDSARSSAGSFHLEAASMDPGLS